MVEVGEEVDETRTDYVRWEVAGIRSPQSDGRRTTDVGKSLVLYTVPFNGSTSNLTSAR